MTCGLILTARFSPELCYLVCSLSKQRAQGRPGAGGTRNTRVQWVVGSAHGFDRYSQDIPAFPAQWYDGLLRALPGERPYLPPWPAENSPPA